MKVNQNMLLAVVAIIAIIIVIVVLTKKQPAERFYSFGASSNISEPLMVDINNPTYNG